MSLPIGRQRRYDLVLASVPVVLLGAVIVSWALDVPLHIAGAASAILAGLVLLTGTASQPPHREDD
jgi:hypothetical protein